MISCELGKAFQISYSNKTPVPLHKKLKKEKRKYGEKRNV